MFKADDRVKQERRRCSESGIQKGYLSREPSLGPDVDGDEARR